MRTSAGPPRAAGSGAERSRRNAAGASGTSERVGDAALYRLGALAFALSGVLNIVVGLPPLAALPVAGALNFLGAAFGLVGLPALYLWQRRAAGHLGLAGYVTASFGLVGVAGFLFADAYVLSSLEPDVRAGLIAGTVGQAIFGSVLLYVAGVVLFGLATLRARVLPWGGAALYALGTLPTPFALALPAVVMAVAETVASVGVLWLAAALARSAGRGG